MNFMKLVNWYKIDAAIREALEEYFDENINTCDSYHRMTDYSVVGDDFEIWLIACGQDCPYNPDNEEKEDN